jgi:D-arabinose 1-dehydrogenase-like Zn-dependent alcohol dehydrogenase
MDRYRVIDLRTVELTIVTLDQAAELAELDADEIVWAIEAEGICETDLHVIAAMDEPAAL